MPEAEIDSLRRIYAAIQRRDSAGLQSNLAHDIEWILPESVPWGGAHHGHDGIEAMIQVFEDHVDGQWSDPDDFLDAGDRVIVLGRLSGRARASDRRFEVPFAHVWGLTDGVPSSCRGYFDTAAIMAALRGDAP
jgi:ketosteroid isomerase-like protein